MVCAVQKRFTFTRFALDGHSNAREGSVKNKKFSPKLIPSTYLKPLRQNSDPKRRRPSSTQSLPTPHRRKRTPRKAQYKSPPISNCCSLPFNSQSAPCETGPSKHRTQSLRTLISYSSVSASDSTTHGTHRHTHIYTANYNQSGTSNPARATHNTA